MGKKQAGNGGLVVRRSRPSKAMDKAIAELLDSVVLAALSQNELAVGAESARKAAKPAVKIMHVLPPKKRNPPKVKSGNMSLEEAVERNGGKFTLSGLKSALLPAGG